MRRRGELEESFELEAVVAKEPHPLPVRELEFRRWASIDLVHPKVVSRGPGPESLAALVEEDHPDRAPGTEGELAAGAQ